MIIENELQYNNKSYGRGNFYVAQIVGTHPTYQISRNFLDKVTDYSGSGTTWYTYTVDITDTGIYEVSEKNNYKKRINYFIYNASVDEMLKISKSDIVELMKKIETNTESITQIFIKEYIEINFEGLKSKSA